MKGLLIKDLRLMMGQRMSVVVILILGVFMGLSQNDINFAVTYIAFVGTVIAQGRVVMLIVAGAVMGIYYFLTEYATEETVKALSFLKEIKLSEVQCSLIFAVVAVVLLLISMTITVKVLKNKEY